MIDYKSFELQLSREGQAFSQLVKFPMNLDTSKAKHVCVRFPDNESSAIAVSGWTETSWIDGHPNEIQVSGNLSAPNVAGTITVELFVMAWCAV